MLMGAKQDRQMLESSEVNANDNVAQPKFMKKRNSFARKVGFTKGMALAA